MPTEPLRVSSASLSSLADFPPQKAAVDCGSAPSTLASKKASSPTLFASRLTWAESRTRLPRSGFASITYVLRPYQLVRARRLNLPEGHNTPRRVL